MDTRDKSKDYSLFKLTALASSTFTEANFSCCRLWPQVCGKSKRDEAPVALHAPSFSLRFIHFLSNILSFPHHCFPFFMCTSPSQSQSVAQSLLLTPLISPLPRLITAIKGAIRYLWLFVLKSLALSDSAPFGDDKLGRHIATVIGPNHSRRLHLLSKMKTTHTQSTIRLTIQRHHLLHFLQHLFFINNIFLSRFLAPKRSRFNFPSGYVGKSISVLIELICFWEMLHWQLTKIKCWTYLLTTTKTEININ